MDLKVLVTLHVGRTGIFMWWREGCGLRKQDLMAPKSSLVDGFGRISVSWTKFSIAAPYSRKPFVAYLVPKQEVSLGV